MFFPVGFFKFLSFSLGKNLEIILSNLFSFCPQMNEREGVGVGEKECIYVYDRQAPVCVCVKPKVTQ